MRAVDPRITLIASGANSFETSTTSAPSPSVPDHRKLPYAYKSPEDWSGQLLARALNSFEIISEHSYPFWNNVFDAEQQKFVPIKESEVDPGPAGDQPDSRRRRGLGRLHEHDPRSEGEAHHDRPRRVGDGRRSRHARARRRRGADGDVPARRRSTNWAPTPGSPGASASMRTTRPTARPASCSGCSASTTAPSRWRSPGTPRRRSWPAPSASIRPAVSSGSETYPLDMTAALSADRRTLTVAVVNPTRTAQDIDLRISGVSLGDAAKAWQMVLPDYNANNVPGQKPVVDIVEVPVKGARSSLSVPPISVSVYAFAVNP